MNYSINWKNNLYLIIIVPSMAESFLFILFKVIWQDLIENIAYDSTKHNWQALQIIIDEIKNNKQISQDLAVALERCFYSSNKAIAEESQEELIKNSTFTQYRGAKIYNPLENDKAIRSLEKKIKLLEKQLKQTSKKLFGNKSVINSNNFEEVLKEIYQSNYESSEEAKKHIQNQLLEEAEKDCDVNLYKIKLRDEKKGLRKQTFHNFLLEIEPNQQLNRIFKARTYLILNNIRK